MTFKVVMVVNPVMLAKDLPKNVKETGADLAIFTAAKTEEELLSMCADADCIITHQSYFPFTPRVFKGLPKCKFLLTASIGYEAIDVEAATEQGIGIVNLRGFCSEELGEHALALMMALARNVVVANNRVRVGAIAPRPNEPAGRGLTVLKGKTLGLIGFGNASRLLVPKARGFDMTVLAYDPYTDKAAFEKLNVEQVSLDRLLEESDFISIHASLTKESQHLIGLAQLKKMKNTAFIVNTARGGIIDEQALCTALTEGYIAGAGLDVTDPEPVPVTSPLMKFDNVILTGHRAGSSRESAITWGIQSAQEVARMIRGEWPLSLVNPGVKEKYAAKWGKMREPEDCAK